MHGGKYFDTTAYRRQMLRFSAKRAAHVVGVSEPTCHHLADSLGLSRERIDLVPNGVRSELGQRARVRQELGIGDDVRLLVAVGNLYKVKDHQTLIRALAMLDQYEDLPPWMAVIAGRGEEESSLRELIRSFALDDRVRLLGLRSDIPDLLASADGWVMSSLSEGLPMALLEAMFASLPVISTSVGGIPTLVRPGQTGWLVPPGTPEELTHAVVALLRDASHAKKLGRRGREIAEAGFGQEKLIAAHLELYRSSSGR
jgi:starch synthase (maltosyl-transferring)